MDVRITELIEEEVEKRVQERLGKVLEHISKTYGIVTTNLLREVGTVQKNRRCMGQTAKKTQCMRTGSASGYCKSHESQKPTIVKRPDNIRGTVARRIPANTGMLIEI
jgi:hypothetical protein